MTTPYHDVDPIQRVLAGLAAAMAREDPHFTDGLRAGRPVAPREYRVRSRRLAVAILAATQVVMLVLGWDPLVIAVGVVALVWAARS